jgi:orotate phosphoribosyltransferase-like protein
MLFKTNIQTEKFHNMKLSELAAELNLSVDTLKKFIIDFDLKLNECMCTNQDVMPDFEKFAKENIEFLTQFEEDLSRINRQKSSLKKYNNR